MNRLKYYREKKGWSVADLSEKSGVSKVTIYKLVFPTHVGVIPNSAS